MSFRANDNYDGKKFVWFPLVCARIGLKVFAHVYELAGAKGLVDANVDTLAHSVRDAEVDDELINAMKEKNVASIATLVRQLSTFVYPSRRRGSNMPFSDKRYRRASWMG